MSKVLEAFGLVKRTCELYIETTRFLKGSDIIANQIKEALNTIQNRLESIDNAEPSEALECLEVIEDALWDDDFHYQRHSKLLDTIKQALLKSQEQEKENELLKEIIKSLFDRGCPLHQYTDRDGVLTIEVDDECSILHLGKYKGVELDKKLKEVLE